MKIYLLLSEERLIAKVFKRCPPRLLDCLFATIILHVSLINEMNYESYLTMIETISTMLSTSICFHIERV